MAVEKSRLITITSHEPSQFNSIEWKVKNFYQSCMALDFVEGDREKPLLKVINQLGGWDVLRSFNLYSWDSHRVLKELHAEHGVDAFFRIDVVNDVRAPQRNVVRVSPAGLGMPHRSYYHRLPDDHAVKAYQTFLKDSAQLFGASSPEAHKFSVDMFNFEKRLSEITPDNDYLDNPLKTSNRMSIKDLHTMSMNIPWLEIMKATFTDAPMSEDTEVVVVSPQYVADIAVVMSTTDRGSLNNYLMWRLVQAYMSYLSKPFREVVDLYERKLRGNEKPLERWQFCFDTTNRFFGHLLNSMFATTSATSKASDLRQRNSIVKKLFDYVKHNVAKSISVSDAYDALARRAAINKLKNMTVQIGTPDFLKDRTYLKLLYSKLLVQKTDFFQNIQYGVMFLRKRQELALVSPAEETKWLDLLLKERRVSYSTAANKIVVPELMLQPPFFDPGFPNAVNLGGVGVRLSEAIIDGVIGFGLLFEPNGLLQFPSLATPKVNSNDTTKVAASNSNFRPVAVSLDKHLQSWRRSTKCLSESYSEAGIDTPDFLRRCRRKSVLELSALQQTFVSFTDMLQLEPGVILPAMETFDPQAVFFLSYAQSLCSKRTMQQRDVDRTVGERLLGEEALRGEISQMPEQFGHFYFCPSGFGDETFQCETVV